MREFIELFTTLILPMITTFIIFDCKPITKINLVKYKYKYVLITILTMGELYMLLYNSQLLNHVTFVIHLNVLTYIGLIVASFIDYLTAKKVIRDNKNLEIDRILSELNIKV